MTREEALNEVVQELAYAELMGRPLTAEDMYALVHSIFNSLEQKDSS